MPKGKTPDTPEVLPSAQEIALTELAMKKSNRHSEVYRPLEQDAINELDRADAGKRSALLSGRANSDLEQQATQLKNTGNMSDAVAGTFGGGGTNMRGFRHANALLTGKNAARTRASQQGRDSIDQDTLNVIKTGQGMSRQAQNALTSSARMEISSDAAKLNAEHTRDQAKAAAQNSNRQAMMEIGMTAGFAGYRGYKNAFNKVDGGLTEGTYKKDYNQLNWAEKGFRDRFGNDGDDPMWGPSQNRGGV